MWDMQVQKKVRSYTGNEYQNFSEIFWSPAGSQIGLLLKNDTPTFVVLNSAQLVPLYAFQVPYNTTTFSWSPDSQKIAFLVDNTDSGDWSVQIWSLQTQKMDAEMAFHDGVGIQQNTIKWSPDGSHIACFSHGHLYIIEVADSLTSSNLSESYDSIIGAWSPDGRYLAVIASHYSEQSDRFDVWNIAEKSIVRSFNLEATILPQAIGWSRDGTQIIVINNLYGQESWDWS